MRIRVAYQGLVYRKVSEDKRIDSNVPASFLQVLRLSSRTLNEFSRGHITNIFSNDAGQIEMAVKNFNHLWVELFTPILDLHSQIDLFLTGWSYRHYWHGSFLLLLCQICFDDFDQLHDRAPLRGLSHRSLLNLFSVSFRRQKSLGQVSFRCLEHVFYKSLINA